MRNENKIKLFLVDDDALYLKMMEIEFLQKADFVIEKFTTGEMCLASLTHTPDVIILDYNLEGTDKRSMTGLDTLDRIKGFNADIPVVILSSQNKIDVAITCMHHRAYDYVVKGETAFISLQKIISAIFRYRNPEKELDWYMERM